MACCYGISNLRLLMYSSFLPVGFLFVGEFFINLESEGHEFLFFIYGYLSLLAYLQCRNFIVD